MTCVICKHSQTVPGVTTITLERGTTTLAFKSVPAQICENRGDAYVDESATQSLINKASVAADAGVEVEVLSYAA